MLFALRDAQRPIQPVLRTSSVGLLGAGPFSKTAMTSRPPATQAQVNWFAAGIDAEEYAHITRADEIVCSGGETSRSCVLISVQFRRRGLTYRGCGGAPSGYCLTNCQLDRSDRSFPPSGPPKGAPKSISAFRCRKIA